MGRGLGAQEGQLVPHALGGSPQGNAAVSHRCDDLCAFSAGQRLLGVAVTAQHRDPNYSCAQGTLPALSSDTVSGDSDPVPAKNT